MSRRRSKDLRRPVLILIERTIRALVAKRARVQRRLVERAARGDQEAFADLARQSADRLFAIAYRILRDHYLAEDAVQQSLITIWNELPRLRDADRFDAWSYRLIVRASTSLARREQRRGAALRLLPEDADRSIAPDELGSLADRDQIDRGFRRLPAEQRAILVLQHFVGLSLAEIADVLSIPVGTAGSRLHYAARALRAALDADARSATLKERSA